MGEVTRKSDHGRSPMARVVMTVVFAVFLCGPTAVVAAAAGSVGVDPVGTGSSGLGGAPTTSDVPASPSHFSFTVTSSLIKGPNGVDINNGAVRNDPGALLFVTPTWDPGEVCGCVYDSHPVGVYYDTAAKEWELFHEDDTAFQPGASYNVLVVPAATANAFRWTATKASISLNLTYISSPATNGRPNAKIIVTQVLPKGSGGVDNNDGVAVAYDHSGGGRWGIYNQLHFSKEPVGATYNVLVGGASTGGGTSLIQTSTKANIAVDSTIIESPVTNNAPNGMVFATNNYNPHGTGTVNHGVANNHVVGALYSGVASRWAVFNEDRATPLVGASMNVLLFRN